MVNEIQRLCEIMDIDQEIIELEGMQDITTVIYHLQPGFADILSGGATFMSFVAQKHYLLNSTINAVQSLACNTLRLALPSSSQSFA